MSDAVKHFGQLVDGVATIATTAPGQAFRIAKASWPYLQKQFNVRIPLGEDMSDYYYDPQLFKMPAWYRKPIPNITGPTYSGMGAVDFSAIPKVAFLAVAGYLIFKYLAPKAPTRNPGRCPAKGAKMTARKRYSLPASDFAVPENDGLPIDTKGRTRAAMSRFNQYRFDSKAQKRRAFQRIVKRADRCNIDSSGFESKWKRRLG